MGKHKSIIIVSVEAVKMRYRSKLKTETNISVIFSSSKSQTDKYRNELLVGMRTKLLIFSNYLDRIEFAKKRY